MIMRALCLFALLGFSSCDKEPLYIRLGDKMAGKFSVKMTQEYGVERSGYGGAMREDLKLFNFTFTSYKKMGVDEARILYVSLVEEFLQAANNDESVRPYLHNYPFTRDNLCMMLNFRDPKNFRRICQPDLSLVIIGSGNIIYFSWDASETHCIEVLREPYFEAYEKVYGKPYVPPQEL